MNKKRILVTGAGSQLGKSLRIVNPEDFEIDFQSKYTLDISKKKEVKKFFNENNFDYCLNFAAYTDVNKAESEPDKCLKVNVKGVENLAKAARKHQFTLIHISTDYVFDGQKNKAYRETDIPHPLNVYGASKLLGEQIIQMCTEKHFIIRTSWLYSAYNNNFVKTILQLSENQKNLRLINDQTGTPTYAPDLIKFILHLIRHTEQNPDKNYYGLYHFSNKGKTNWYEFGKEILKLSGKTNTIIPISSSMFDSPAKRPVFSVLSKKKIEQTFGYRPRHWKKALKNFIQKS